MLIRPARKRDLTGISRLFGPWFNCSSRLDEILKAFRESGSLMDGCFCDVLENEGDIACASLWQLRRYGHVDLLALNYSQDPALEDLVEHFIEYETVEWSGRKAASIAITIPGNVGKQLPDFLKKAGFVFESFSDLNRFAHPTLSMTKTLIYETVHYDNMLEFLKTRFTAYGFEISPEAAGFAYRVKDAYQKPFIVGTWHRVVTSGNDLIIYPPAKKIEPHELETMFYPLRITGHGEAPILVTLDKKRACSIIHLPDEEDDQKSMFNEDSELVICPFNPVRDTYSIVSGHKSLRKGLPLLFYVNGLGAVGEARVVDWMIESGSNFDRIIDKFPAVAIDDLDTGEIKSGSKFSQLLKISFNFYRSFPKAISFEKIRSLDPGFNPQRRRHISDELFESITSMAYDKN